MQEIPLIKLIRYWGYVPAGGAVKLLKGQCLGFHAEQFPTKGLASFTFYFPRHMGYGLYFSLKIEDVAIGSISRTYNLSGST